jgi:hypothetical protein
MSDSYDGAFRERVRTDYRIVCDWCNAHISTGHRKITWQTAQKSGWCGMSVTDDSQVSHVLCPTCVLDWPKDTDA